MTVTYVTLILDRYDGAGNPLVKGGGSLSPSLEFPDAADQMLIGQAPVPFAFRAGSLPQVTVLPNDLYGPQGDSSPGWTWNVTYDSGTPGGPAAASYYILSTNGDTQYLSDLASVPAAQPGEQYVPLPDTPPADDTYVLGLSSASPLVTEWVEQSGGGGGGSGTVTSVAVETANGFAGTVANDTTDAQITLKANFTSGIVKAGSGGAISAASAGTDYLTPTGSAAGLTSFPTLNQNTTGTAAGLSGTPALPNGTTATTQSADDDSTKLATTAYADAAASAAQSAAESASDPSGSASTAQSNAESFATSAVAAETSRAETAEALLAPLASPALTGNPTAPTQSAGNDSTRLATTAYADAAVAVETSRAETAEALKAPLASPTFTGTPAAPTASALTDSTQVATTAYADAAVAVETSRAETAEALKLAKAGGTMTGWLAPKVVTLSDGSSVALDASTGNSFTWALGGSSHTLAAPSNPADGQAIKIRIKYGGSYTPEFNAVFDFGAAGAPSWTATSGKTDICGFEYDASLNSGAGEWAYLGSVLGLAS